MLRVVIAGVRAGGEFTLSTPVGLPPAVRRVLGELDIPVYVETDELWVHRMGGRDPEDAVADVPLGAQIAPLGRPSRTRLIGSAEAVASLRTLLADGVAGDPDLAVYAGDVTTAGRVELLPFLREQSITITAHRFGNKDDWSADVI